MGELRSKDKYSGTVGELVFVEMNGKTFVRKKRSKMSKAAKKKPSWRGTVVQNNRFALATAFAKLLRDSLPEFSSYSHLHSRLSGGLNRMIQKDHVHGRDEFQLLPEHFQGIGEIIANDLMPGKMGETLQSAEVKRTNSGLRVSLGRLRLDDLKNPFEGIEVWVRFLVIDQKEKPREIYREEQGTGVMPKASCGDIFFEFKAPRPVGNQVSVLIIGFKSYASGKQIENLSMNGFVYKQVM
jgi:hypothetical protein